MAGSVMRDLTGLKYGSLTILHFHHMNERHEAYWTCSCDCGNTFIGRGSGMRAGAVSSCGCSRTTHGHNKDPANGGQSPTWKSWNAMHSRCGLTNHTSFKNYGAKGVKVCLRWGSFENFLKDMGERPAGKTLDRYPNKTGNYEKENCRWATVVEQNRNTTSTKLSMEKAEAIRGDPRRQSEIAKSYGISQGHVSAVKLHKRW